MADVSVEARERMKTEYIREDRTVEGWYIETHYTPCKGIADANGYLRVLVDEEGYDTETRILHETLNGSGWVKSAALSANNQERAAGTVGVSDEALLKTWLACKSIDNRQFCVEFGRAVLTLVDHSSAMEKIAQQWDGCFCEIASVGQVDIGAAIRSDWDQYNHLAATSTKPADEGAAVKEVHMPHRCIKPHCPADCSGCNHTISGRDEARNLICDMLDEFANDGHGATFEDGEHPLVDRARAYLFRANAEFEPLYATPQPPTAEPVDPAYPFYELKFIMRVLSHKGGAPKQDWDTAYGMAREIFSRWHKDRQSTAEGQTKQGRAEGESLTSARLCGLKPNTEKTKCTTKRTLLPAPTVTTSTPPMK